MAEIPLDDDDMDGMDDVDDVAAAMGFSGFGQQRPAAKKRKFNPQADACVSATSPRRPDASDTTGANTAPLGERRPRPPMNLPPPVSGGSGGAGGGNADEIDLDDEQDEDGAGGAGSVDVGRGGLDDAGLRFIDTSRPSRDLYPEEVEETEAQARIDAIVGGIPSSLASGHGYHQRQTGREAARSGPTTHVHGTQTSRSPWWEGYWDSRMLENPWEKLEKERGLETRGTWVPRGGGAPGNAAQQVTDAPGGSGAVEATSHES